LLALNNPQTESEITMCITGGHIGLDKDTAALGSPLEVERMRRRAAAQQTIFLEGHPRTHVYVVESGWVKLYRTLIDGQRQVVGFHDHGAILGLEGAGQYFNSGEAVTAVQLRAIPAGRLADLCARDSDFANHLLQQVGAQLGSTQSHLTTVGAQSAEQKVATFLLAMSAHDAGGDEFDLPMRRIEMGEFLGLRLETISRKMSEFQRRKWISLSSIYRCRILNRAVLLALAEGGAPDERDSGRLHG
jgi:CRP-like cAMP-binding protein